MTSELKIDLGDLSKLVEYQSNSIVSRSILKKSAGSVTIFAFDEGEKLSEHKTPYDAMIQIVDGAAEITISGKINVVEKDQYIILPSNQPHAVTAIEKFKMVLTMIKS